MTQTNSICSWLRLTACVGFGISLAVSPTLSCADDASSLRHTTTVLAIQKAEPAVVNIEGNKPASSGRAGDSQQVNGMGAGVIVDQRGYILTNQHVVQDVGVIEVTLTNGRQYVGRLVDRDPNTDLAMIKIDATHPLPVIDCGTSSDLMRGEPVIAIGNPYGYHNTVTEGIISALKRDIPVNGVQDYPDLIQTDASINPGNSGGPLLNAMGQMIGINAAVRIGAQGIGFAIPVDRAINIAAQMIARQRKRIGSNETPFAVRTNYKDGKSYVRVVGSSTPSGLKDGDVIRAIDNRPIENRLDFELALLGRSAGTTIEIDADRAGDSISAAVKMPSRRSTKAQLASTSSLQQQVYEKLGVRLEPADGRAVRRIDKDYSGGLRVTSVRENSPAYIAQIQSGDIIVGLLEWQTPDWKDLSWVMSKPEVTGAKSAKFHIMRGTEVFWGTLELSRRVR